MRSIRLGALLVIAAACLRPMQAAVAAGFGPDAYPIPAGDLDGDGFRDVIVSAGGQSETATVTALKGTDGSTLWSSSTAIPGDDAWNMAYPLPLGPAGEPGVLVVAGRSVGDSRALHLTALGSGGTQIWRRSVTGSIAFGVPIFYNVLHANGAADDVLIGRVSRSESLELITAAVVAGEDGSVGGRAVALGGRTTAAVIGDVSRDGLDDYALLSTGQAIGAPAMRLTAHRGTDGGPLWTAALPGDADAVMRPVPDATGDTYGEVAVWTAPTYPETPNLRLLDGRDGGTRWVKTVKHLAAIGDVNGDGRAEILTANDTYQPGPLVTAELRFEAVQGTGATLYSTVHTVSFPLGGSAPCADFGPAGDAGADAGAGPDVRYQVYSDCRYRSPAQGGVVRGSDGSVAWFKPVAGDALAASVDGAGDDLATFAPAGGSTTVTVSDGADGSTVWMGTAPGAYLGSVRTGVAVDLDGDGRAEVLPLIFGGPVTALRGTNGSILWTR
ncbi:MAG: hypothetical protein ACRDJM_02755 [Actinomycetota bacterium]